MACWGYEIKHIGGGRVYSHNGERRIQKMNQSKHNPRLIIGRDGTTITLVAFCFTGRGEMPSVHAPPFHGSPPCVFHQPKSVRSWLPKKPFAGQKHALPGLTYSPSSMSSTSAQAPLIGSAHQAPSFKGEALHAPPQEPTMLSEDILIFTTGAGMAVSATS